MDIKYRKRMALHIIIFNLLIFFNPAVLSEDEETSAVAGTVATGEEEQKVEPVQTEADSGNEKTQYSLSDSWIKVLEIVIWPIFFLILVWKISGDSKLKYLLINLFSRLKLSTGNIEVEFSGVSAKEVQVDFQSAYTHFMSKADDEFKRTVKIKGIYDRLKNIHENLKSQISTPNPNELRSTIYIQDIIFKNYLYQLTDYYPKKGGACRRFSVRYGIIGTAWRLNESMGTGDALKALKDKDIVESLIKDWGMLHDEAVDSTKQRLSYMLVMLEHKDIPIGILYIDHPDKNAFQGDDKKTKYFAKQLESDTHIKELIVVLHDSIEPIRDKGTFLDIQTL